MINISPLSGYKNTTIFTFTNSDISEESNVIWGDDTTSQGASAMHVYSEIGLYSAFGGTCSSTSAFNLSVYEGEYFKDQLFIARSALSSLVTNPFVFTIYLSSKNPTNTIFLYSSGSNSIPYNSTRNFWSHLNPEWEFLYNDLAVDSITMTGTPIYSDTRILGYSAMSVVKYKDDMPGNPILFFTLENKEYNLPTNSRVYAAISHSICAVDPDKLIITSDGINPINKIQWADKQIPYVISVGSSILSSDSILHYVSGNITNVKMSSNCYNFNLSSFQYNVSPIFLFDENCFSSGGYLLSTFFYPSSALPPIEISNDLDSCNSNFDKIEFVKNRNSPKNIILSATGIFSYNDKTFSLSGISNTFDILAFENRHQFYRKGEDYNVYEILKQSLPFDLNEYSNFNSYLSAIAGEGDSLGKVYDKISNFALDHSDIDVCNIESISDKYAKFDDSLEDFGLEFPEELRRLFHFSSIPLQKLIGTRCSCNTNFINCAGCQATNICTICKYDKKSNLGEQILSNSLLTVGETILYRENGSEVFNFLSIEDNGKQQFPLSELNMEPFYSKGLFNYCFFRWNKTPQNNPIQSVVNYKDSRNLLNPALSSNSDWYSDNGIIEEMFNYVLTKNLL
jgi:hypothetical protein